MEYIVSAYQINYDGEKRLLLNATGVCKSTVDLIISHYGSPLNIIQISKIVSAGKPIIDEQTERECEE